jgi:hypothetical protein
MGSGRFFAILRFDPLRLLLRALVQVVTQHTSGEILQPVLL